MSFYKFGMPKKAEPQDEQDPEILALSKAVVEAVEAAKMVLAEHAAQQEASLHKIAVVQIASMQLLEDAIVATLRHPEPGRVALAKKFYDALSSPNGLIVKIGALAKLAGHTRDRGDGTTEIRVGGK